MPKADTVPVQDDDVFENLFACTLS